MRVCPWSAVAVARDPRRPRGRCVASPCVRYATPPRTSGLREHDESRERDGEPDALGETDGDAPKESEAVGERETDGEADGEMLALAIDCETDGETDGETLALALDCETDGETDEETLALGLALADGDVLLS